VKKNHEKTVKFLEFDSKSSSHPVHRCFFFGTNGQSNVTGQPYLSLAPTDGPSGARESAKSFSRVGANASEGRALSPRRNAPALQDFAADAEKSVLAVFLGPEQKSLRQQRPAV
jgi:hypothetical protein